MREDACGLFWDDTPPPKVSTAKPVVKREPPPRTWEDPGYLPYLEEARRFPVSLFTPEELVAACCAREPLLFDTEVYSNYFLAAFASLVSGKVIYFEMRQGESIDTHRLLWVLKNFLIIGFNLDYFDLPVAALACEGLSPSALKLAANRIISENVKPWMVLKAHGVRQLRINRIDLINVCPLQASLKIYGGRVHVPRMQELPFHHAAILTEDQMTVVRWYCIGSDLVATGFLYMELESQIKLREAMGQMYGVDLRSKSDAQIAEAVLVHELTRINCGVKPTRPEIPPGTTFRYRMPDYIQFSSSDLQFVKFTVANANFIIGENGSPELPEEIKVLKIPIAGNEYQMGIGGLHSTETKMMQLADADHLLVDRDVASYYPSIILNQGLFPKHLGASFLEVYRTIVERRLAAKKAKNMTEANTLKIVINGSFGKLGNKWSALYAPDLMVQVTITGQLSLLMLIERLTLAGIPVCSANTDGVLIRCPKDRVGDYQAVVSQWERDTCFTTEETSYRGIFARDVNNYIAAKESGKPGARFLDEQLGCKVKGIYCERGSAGDSVLSKNPQNLICSDAVLRFLMEGKPISETIRECRDIRRFITVRTVAGGAYWLGGAEYLGKAIRWYQATGIPDSIIVYANGDKAGDKVPSSEGCRPCMQLPEAFPDDVDFERYEAEAFEILRDIGYPMP